MANAYNLYLVALNGKLSFGRSLVWYFSEEKYENGAAKTSIMVCGISIFASWVRSRRRRALSQLCLPVRGKLHRFKRDIFALESFTYFLYISIGAPSIIGDSKRIKKTGSISNKCETPIMCGIYISADNRIQVLCLAANRQRLERMHNSAISCNMINLACKKISSWQVLRRY